MTNYLNGKKISTIPKTPNLIYSNIQGWFSGQFYKACDFVSVMGISWTADPGAEGIILDC
jgi:hypothetical protein